MTTLMLVGSHKWRMRSFSFSPISVPFWKNPNFLLLASIRTLTDITTGFANTKCRRHRVMWSTAIFSSGCHVAEIRPESNSGPLVVISIYFLLVASNFGLPVRLYVCKSHGEYFRLSKSWFRNKVVTSFGIYLKLHENVTSRSWNVRLSLVIDFNQPLIN